MKIKCAIPVAPSASVFSCSAAFCDWPRVVGMVGTAVSTLGVVCLLMAAEVEGVVKLLEELVSTKLFTERECMHINHQNLKVWVLTTDN